MQIAIRIVSVVGLLLGLTDTVNAANILNWWDHFLQDFPGQPAPTGEPSRVFIRNWRQALNGNGGNGPGGNGGNGMGGGSTVGINTEDLIFVLNGPGNTPIRYSTPNTMPGMEDTIVVVDQGNSSVIQTGSIGPSFFDVFYEMDSTTVYPYDVKATASGTITGNLSGGPNNWGNFVATLNATYFLDLGPATGAIADPWNFLVTPAIVWSEIIVTSNAGTISVGNNTPGAHIEGHLDVEEVPEASTFVLASAALGLFAFGRRRHFSQSAAH